MARYRRWFAVCRGPRLVRRLCRGLLGRSTRPDAGPRPTESPRPTPTVCLGTLGLRGRTDMPPGSAARGGPINWFWPAASPETAAAAAVAAEIRPAPAVSFRPTLGSPLTAGTAEVPLPLTAPVVSLNARSPAGRDSNDELGSERSLRDVPPDVSPPTDARTRGKILSSPRGEVGMIDGQAMERGWVPAEVGWC